MLEIYSIPSYVLCNSRAQQVELGMYFEADIANRHLMDSDDLVRFVVEAGRQIIRPEQVK